MSEVVFLDIVVIHFFSSFLYYIENHMKYMLLQKNFLHNDVRISLLSQLKQLKLFDLLDWHLSSTQLFSKSVEANKKLKQINLYTSLIDQHQNNFLDY